MKIIQLGFIIEVRIPIAKLNTYKTKHRKEMFIKKSISYFVDNELKSIGIFKIHATNGIHTAYGEELCEVNDFGYSAVHKYKQNPTKKTFRFFGGEIYCAYKDWEIENKDMFPIPEVSTYKGNEFRVNVCSFKEWKDRI